MGLGHFEIEHVFLDSYFGDDGEEDFKITATTETRWNYMQAKIKWYLLSVVRHSDETIIRVLVHELCHVLLAAEQGLIDARLMWESYDRDLSEREADELTERYYELLELSTEMTTRAILNGWQQNAR